MQPIKQRKQKNKKHAFPPKIHSKFHSRIISMLSAFMESIRWWISVWASMNLLSGCKSFIYCERITPSAQGWAQRHFGKSYAPFTNMVKLYIFHQNMSSTLVHIFSSLLLSNLSAEFYLIGKLLHTWECEWKPVKLNRSFRIDKLHFGKAFFIELRYLH